MKVGPHKGGWRACGPFLFGRKIGDVSEAAKAEAEKKKRKKK